MSLCKIFSKQNVYNTQYLEQTETGQHVRDKNYTSID